MRQQLKYDFTKLIFQKKYGLIFAGFMICCVGYAIRFTNKGFDPMGVLNESMYSIRPIYWLVCAYMIWDIYSSDYHFETLKTVIPAVKSRAVYLASKTIVSAVMCYLAFVCYVQTMYVSSTAAFHGGSISATLPFLSMSVGDIAGILFLIGTTSFCAIISENEIATIGSSMGCVMIMTILETVESISRFLPTTWFAVFPKLINHKEIADLLIIAGLIGLALVLYLFAGRIFKRKDLFL